VQQFLIFTVAGLSSAGIYAISASGLTLKYTTTGVFDWAHGAMGMVAAFVYWQFRFEWGWPAPMAFGICMFVLAPLGGIALQRLVMGRLQGTSEATRLVVTLALALLLIGVVQGIWNPADPRTSQPLFSGEVIELGGVRLAYNDLIVLVMALAVAVALRIIMYRTRRGVAMRATVDDPMLASLNGAAPDRSATTAWILGTMLAALAGILVAPTLSLSAVSLTLLIINGYAAAVIGRLRSVPWTFAGAIILGLSVSYTIGYLPRIETGAQYLRGLPGAVPAIVLFIALLLMPRPRLRLHDTSRVREVSPKPTWKGTGLFGLGVIALALVLVSTLSAADLFASTGAWGLGIVGLSLIPIVGYSGKLSLCQLTLAAVGAVVVSHAGGSAGNPLSLLLAGLVAGVVGILVALPALRLSGIYLALSTAAFAIIMDNWIFALPSFTVFGNDFAIWSTGSLNFTRFAIGDWSVEGTTAYFMFGAVAFVVMAIVVTAIRRSTFGLRLLALKDSEAAYATLGMNRQAAVLAVFGVSAAMAGVGGGIFGAAVQSTAPNRFDFFNGLTLLLVMVVFGLRSPLSAVIAGFYLGSPLFSNLFPGTVPVPVILIGIAGVAIGRDPNGVIPTFTGRLDVIRRRPVIAAALGAGFLIAWVLVLADTLSGAQWFAVTVALVVAALIIAEFDERLDRDLADTQRRPWAEALSTQRLVVVVCLALIVAVAILVAVDVVDGWPGLFAIAALVVTLMAVAASEHLDARKGLAPELFTASDQPATEPVRLSAPVEALGLLVPFTHDDVDALDRALELPTRERTVGVVR
jgi:branched-chain amino acid transport system permease protein